MSWLIGHYNNLVPLGVSTLPFATTPRNLIHYQVIYMPKVFVISFNYHDQLSGATIRKHRYFATEGAAELFRRSVKDAADLLGYEANPTVTIQEVEQ